MKNNLQIKYIYPRWGSDHIPWKSFVKNVKAMSFDGIETPLPGNNASEIAQIVKDEGLLLIIQHYETTLITDFSKQAEAFKRYLYAASELDPLFINSQTGKDHFCFHENASLIKIASDIEKETGIRILHETHRGKWSFAAHITKEFLLKQPEIRLTLDVSHWFCTAESYLEDQPESIQLALQHTDYIHARIGHTQGAQVSDVRAPLWKPEIDRHFFLWDQVLSHHKNDDFFCICPEFGAPPYAHLDPYTGTEIASQRDMNVFMKELLMDRYK